MGLKEGMESMVAEAKTNSILRPEDIIDQD